MPPTGYGPGTSNVPQPIASDEGDVERGERGYRRRKLAALAGNLYRTGQQAVTEIKETYAQSRARDLDGDFDGQGTIHIPGAFPDVAITSQGNEQMSDTGAAVAGPPGGLQDEDYWRQEWEREQDEKAIVDVDVRGWIYSPHVGPMTRRNRFLIGLARQLSGISAPRADQNQGNAGFQMNDELREQEKIAQEAAKIERKGQEEKHIASRGAYSENPREGSSLGDSGYALRPPRSIGGTLTPDSAPGSPSSLPRQPSTAGNELTDAELAVANANLMARIAPFMTNPLVALPITVFFYNDTKSQSRTVMTNDAGHFVIRAPLDFVPTNIRVLANERISATQEIKLIEPYGVSLISDIDDTIKMSNISGGAREIFRNTFVRELADLSIEGVREWYSDMHALGLFPMLATFFKLSGLPPGSLHLKQYSGMLQGIFEPVAERKKNTLVRLLRDFPNRKFLLVGDSGEADLEVYTELAAAYPGRVLAVFIRDVTTPEGTPYFEPSFDMARQGMSSMISNDGRPNGGIRVRQNSAPGSVSGVKASTGPTMGTLIDFSEEPEEAALDQAATLEQMKRSRPGPSVSATDLLSRKLPPPPRPVKPAALSSTPSLIGINQGTVGLGLSGVNTGSDAGQPPPKPPRKPVAIASGGQALHPLAQVQNSSQKTLGYTKPRDTDRQLPPPPPPRRRATPSSSVNNLSPRMFAQGRGPSANSDVEFDPLPPSLAPTPATGMTYYRSSSRSGNTSPSGSPPLGPVNKKLELWRRRVARAQDQLDQLGVSFYTWRKGQDVEVEALGIVRRALDEMGQRRR
ncbi:Phosphatidate phosphatase APP1 [Cladobotryum mycophilum]|uniref:Phosphatidate phosphatase APP1 n=1 Tax=Cladobotryum mycophilum TaxID=491253 RepID=A0ABR0SD32_9HYPO